MSTEALRQPDNNSETVALWVDEHFDYLYSYAYRYFRSEDRADELVQETFLAAVESFSRFEGKSSARTWLVGILRHKIMDQLKRKSKEEKFEHAPADQDEMDRLFDQSGHWHSHTGPLLWGEQPESTLTRKELMGAIEQCLTKLPRKIREIFLLRELEGYQREEISDQFSLSVTNIGVILHRARLSLQQCLQVNWFKSSSKENAS